MSEIITYKFDSERWTRLFSKMKENDIAIGGAKSRRIVDKAAQIVAAFSKSLAPKDSGALQDSIITKTVRAKGYPAIFGNIGIRSKSLYVSAQGSIRKPSHYYYIHELGRTSNEARALNQIANRMNPNRKLYKNRTPNSETKHPFLAPAIRQAGPAAGEQMYNDFVKLMESEMEKAKQ